MTWLTSDGYKVTSGCAFLALGFSGSDSLHMYVGHHCFCKYYQRGY